MNKYMLGMMAVFVLGVSGVNAATYDASYGTVTGTSKTKYTDNGIGGSFILDGGSTQDYQTYDTVYGSSGEDADALAATTIDMNSNEKNERAFINEVFGAGTATFLNYTKIESGFTVSKNDTTGLSSLNLGDIFEDGYFILKFGATADFSHYLFKNIDPLSTLTWLTSVSYKENKDSNGGSVLGLSHYSSVPCPEGSEDCGLPIIEIPEVPIPAAIWLFGSALLGFTAFGSKKKAA